MAGTPPAIPPDTPEVMDMSWEFTGPPVNTGPPINTAPPYQPLQNINETFVTGNGHFIQQPEERVDNDIAIARHFGNYTYQGHAPLPPIGRHNRNAATARNVVPFNNVAQASRIATASHRPSSSLLSRGRGSTNIATARNLPPGVTTNARSQRIPNTSNLFRRHNSSARNDGPRLQAGSRPSTNARAPRTVNQQYIHDIYHSTYELERQRLIANAPSFRVSADDSLQTSPLLQSIQRESLARSQSPRQDPVVPQLKRRLGHEAASAGRSEDRYFHGERYFSTIGAVQTTDEAKRRLISPRDEEETTTSARRSSTHRRPSSIFFQDLTRSPGHRPVTPITPPRFRGNGRSMPGAWPKSPVTPLTLDTSTVLLTPPLTPDMSTLPGAWPRSPEPLPFTTIGTAPITPPESPLDGIPTTRVENVAGRIPELLAIPARAGVHLTEDVAGRLHELLAISSRAGVHLTEDVVGRLHELLTISSRTGLHISEDVASRLHGLLAIPSRTGVHISAAIRGIFCRSEGAPATLARPDAPEHHGEPVVWPEGPEEYQRHPLDPWTQNAVLALEEMGNMNSPPPTQYIDWHSQTTRRLPPTQRARFPENPVTRVKKYAIGETISYPSPTSTISSHDESSLLNLSPSAQLSRELVETVSPQSPTSSLSSDDGSPPPSLEPSTPTKDDHTAPTDPASAQLTQELEDFLLRSDRHQEIRDVEQEEAEKARQAQAAEEARQAEAEEERKKAEDEARKKIEEDESCKKSGRRRLPANRVLEPLTAEWDTKLRDTLAKRPNEVVARTSAGNELDRRDIGKVLPQPGTADDPSGWVNDNVITGYLDSVVDYGLQARGHKRGETPKLHAFNTAFYNNITEKGVESVKRWSRRPKISGKDLLKVEHVFIPVNVGGAHWTLLVVSPVWKRIEYFDSLHGSSVAAIRNAKAWIKMELGDAWNEREWEVVEDPGLAGRGKGPRQSNSSDCGIFTITTAKMITLGVDPMAITASDMPLQRKRVVVELVNGGFHGDFEPSIVF